MSYRLSRDGFLLIRPRSTEDVDRIPDKGSNDKSWNTPSVQIPFLLLYRRLFNEQSLCSVIDHRHLIWFMNVFMYASDDTATIVYSGSLSRIYQIFSKLHKAVEAFSWLISLNKISEYVYYVITGTSSVSFIVLTFNSCKDWSYSVISIQILWLSIRIQSLIKYFNSHKMGTSHFFENFILI